MPFLSVKQSQGPCELEEYTGGTCVSLILFTTSNMLPSGRFLSFLGSDMTAINFGEINFYNAIFVILLARSEFAIVVNS